MSTKYAITIKCVQHGHNPTESENLVVFTNLIRCHQASYSSYVFEQDSRGITHLHGLMSARKNILLSKFKVKFWHIYVVALPSDDDISNWVRYMHKDVRKEQAETIKEIRSGYPFQD